ncbi:hypothetical protein [Kitasatospora sp. NPDC004289]
MRATAPLTLLLAALAALAACSPAPGAGPGSRPPDPVREVRTGADIVLPFDAYLMTADQERTVARAEQLLAGDCLRRFGLDWRPAAPPPDAAGPVNAQRYGLIDPAEAERLGYHPLPRPAAEAAPEPTPEVVTAYGGKGAAELNGVPVPEGGCLGEARRTLGVGRFSQGSIELNRIPTDSFTRAGKDPRTVAATAEWSACMQRAGYSYPDIWRANDDPRWNAAQPTELERATARADVACKAATRLPTVLLTVESDLQRAAIEAHRPALDRAREHQGAVLAKAAEVLGAPARQPSP